MGKSICQVLGFIVILSYISGLNPIFAQKIPVLRFLPKITISPPDIYSPKEAKPSEEKSSLALPEPSPTMSPNTSPSPSPSPTPKDKRWGIQYKFSIGEQTNNGENK